MKVIFRKAIALVGLFALTLGIAPPNLFTAPVNTLLPTVEAAVGDDVCESSELADSFAIDGDTNGSATINGTLNFTWEHDVDAGDCDDATFRIQYSGDNGVTWVNLKTQAAEAAVSESYDFPGAYLGDNGGILSTLGFLPQTEGLILQWKQSLMLL